MSDDEMDQWSISKRLYELIIEILWKFTLLFLIQPRDSFVRMTKARLSWYMQKRDLIWYYVCEKQHNYYVQDLDKELINRLWNGVQ